MNYDLMTRQELITELKIWKAKFDIRLKEATKEREKLVDEEFSVVKKLREKLTALSAAAWIKEVEKFLNRKAGHWTSKINFWSPEPYDTIRYNYSRLKEALERYNIPDTTANM